MDPIFIELVFTLSFIVVATVISKITKRINSYTIWYLTFSIIHGTIVTVLFLSDRIDVIAFTRCLIVFFPGGYSAYRIASGPFRILFPDEETVKICGLVVWILPYVMNIMYGGGAQRTTLIFWSVVLILVSGFLLYIMIRYNPPRDISDSDEQ